MIRGSSAPSLPRLLALSFQATFEHARTFFYGDATSRGPNVIYDEGNWEFVGVVILEKG